MTSSVEYLRLLARAQACWDRKEWFAAAQLWERVVAANPVNGNHWDRLAHSRFYRGDYVAAIPAFEQALRLGVSATREDIAAPGVLTYRIACCYARSGQDERAIATLADAKARGYRDLADVLDDQHFTTLRDEPRLRELVDAAPARELGRDEGWQLDTRRLTAEIERRSPDPAAGQASGASERLLHAIPTLTDAQIVAELTRMVARLDDGHAFVEVPEGDRELTRQLPLQFYLFEEGLHVVAATPPCRQLLGARVVAVDGRGVDDVLAALWPLVARDNDPGGTERVVQVLRRLPIVHAVDAADRPDAVTLTVQLHGHDTTTEVSVPAEPGPWASRNELPAPPGWLFFPDTLPDPLPLYLRNCGAAYWFEHLPAEQTVYFQFTSIRDDPGEPIAEFARRLFRVVDEHDVQRLVIDLRWNGGGNNMLVQPLIHGLIGCDAVNRPGGLFVIIGRRTFSAAQYTANAIEANTAAIFVGEPTGSRPNFIGETKPFRLPYSGIRANVSDMYWQNSWPFDHRRWIAPELYIPPTFAAFSTNRDPALDAILSYRENLPGRLGG